MLRTISDYEEGRYRDILLLFFIILLAAFLRIYNLGKLSLWLDEGISVRRALMSIGEMSGEVSRNNHPPLYFLLLHYWVKLGAGDSWPRALSAIFGIASIPVLYRLADTLFDRKTALLSALFLALSPFHIQYSQEARSYSLLFLLSLILFYNLIKAVKTGRWTNWAGYILAGTLMLYTHGIAPLYLLLFSVVLIVKSDMHFPRVFKNWLAANLFVVLFFLPWIFIYARQVDLTVRTFWADVPSLMDVIYLFVCYTCPVNYFFKGVSDLFKVDPSYFTDDFFRHVVASLLALTGFIALYISALRRGYGNKTRETALLVFILVAPVIAVYIFSLTIRSIFEDKIMISSLAAVPVLLSEGFVSSGRKFFWKIVLSAALIASAVSVFGYYESAKKEDWRGAAEYVAKNYLAGDVIAFSHKDDRYMFDWYLGDNKDYRTAEKIFLYKKDGLKPMDDYFKDKEFERVWLVLRCANAKEDPGPVLKLFNDHFQPFSEKRVEKVIVYGYKKREH